MEAFIYQLLRKKLSKKYNWQPRLSNRNDDRASNNNTLVFIKPFKNNK